MYRLLGMFPCVLCIYTGLCIYTVCVNIHHQLHESPSLFIGYEVVRSIQSVFLWVMLVVSICVW